MSLSKRLQQLFRADVNHVLETLEDPQSMLKLSLFEMQQCINELKQQSLVCQEKSKQAEKVQQDLKQKLSLQEENLKLSLQQQDEQLIKRQIKRKLELEKMFQQKENQIKDFQQNIKDLEEELLIKNEKLDFLKQKEAMIQNHSISPSVSHDHSQWQITPDEIELEYLRIMKQQSKTSEVKS